MSDQIQIVRREWLPLLAAILRRQVKTPSHLLRKDLYRRLNADMRREVGSCDRATWLQVFKAAAKEAGSSSAAMLEITESFPVVRVGSRQCRVVDMKVMAHVKGCTNRVSRRSWYSSTKSFLQSLHRCEFDRIGFHPRGYAFGSMTSEKSREEWRQALSSAPALVGRDGIKIVSRHPIGGWAFETAKSLSLVEGGVRETRLGFTDAANAAHDHDPAIAEQAQVLQDAYRDWLLSIAAESTVQRARVFCEGRTNDHDPDIIAPVLHGLAVAA